MKSIVKSEKKKEEATRGAREVMEGCSSWGASVFEIIFRMGGEGA